MGKTQSLLFRMREGMQVGMQKREQRDCKKEREVNRERAVRAGEGIQKRERKKKGKSTAPPGN